MELFDAFIFGTILGCILGVAATRFTERGERAIARAEGELKGINLLWKPYTHALIENIILTHRLKRAKHQESNSGAGAEPPAQSPPL